MNAQSINEILDALALRFGSTGAHLWAAIQRQAIVEFSLLLVGTVVSAILLWLSFRWLNDQDKPDEPLPWIALVCTGLITVILSICTLCATAGVLNPEYFALARIMKMLTGAGS